MYIAESKLIKGHIHCERTRERHIFSGDQIDSRLRKAIPRELPLIRLSIAKLGRRLVERHRRAGLGKTDMIIIVIAMTRILNRTRAIEIGNILPIPYALHIEFREAPCGPDISRKG
jgi:hypothetical protein